MSWTPETLKEYVDRELECLRDASRQAQRELLTRLEDLAPWRLTISEMVSKKVDRLEWDRHHQSLREQTELTRREIESLSQGQRSAEGTRARLIAVSGVIATVVGLLSGGLVTLLHYLLVLRT